MQKPVKRDMKIVQPLINTFVMHYIENFGEYPTKAIVDRSIKLIIKKKQEEFILGQFSLSSWSMIDLVDVSNHVAERVIDLKEIEAKDTTSTSEEK